MLLYLYSIQKLLNGGVPYVGVLKNFAKFTRKHLYQGLFLSAASNFINEKTPAQCFPKPLTIFAKSSVVDFRLGYKCARITSRSKTELQRLSSVKVND